MGFFCTLIFLPVGPFDFTILSGSRSTEERGLAVHWADLKGEEAFKSNGSCFVCFWGGSYYVAQAGLALMPLPSAGISGVGHCTMRVFFLMLWFPTWMLSSGCSSLSIPPLLSIYKYSLLCNRFLPFSVILVWQVDISLRYTRPWNNTERDRFQVSICS